MCLDLNLSGGWGMMRCLRREDGSQIGASLGQDGCVQPGGSFVGL